MTTVTLPSPVLEATFAKLRECGAGRRECVVYWVADQASVNVVTACVHPDHRAGVAGYEVDSGWVTDFFLDLRRERRRAVAQVHTHPGAASHSETDDAFALAPQTGFLSLVIPNFATSPATLHDAHLVRMESSGAWAEMVPEEVFTHG